MATQLLKDINREFRIGNDVFIVTLCNDYSLTFRRKGTKTRFNVPLAGCYNLAIINQGMKEYQAKVDRYNSRKKLGQVAKKPKKPSIGAFFNPKYSVALRMTA
jgi:hypothetical protein